MLFTRTQKKQLSSKGFTLVETLIYLSFTVIFSGLVIASLLTVTKSFYTLRLTRDLTQSGTVAFERVLREIRGAYDIDNMNTNFYENPGKLVLRKRDTITKQPTTIEFYVNSTGQLAMREGGVDKGTLMGTNVTVTDFKIRDLDANWFSHAGEIELAVEAKDSLSGGTISQRFISTAVLRAGIAAPY